MTTKSIRPCLLVAVMLVSLTGCSQQSTPPAPPPAPTNAVAATMDSAKNLAGKTMDSAKDMTAKAVDSTKEATTKAVDATKDFTTKAVDSTKDFTSKAVDDVKAALPGATDTATTKYNEVVASAKQYIADKKYQDALDELKKLSDVKLSDDQQKVVDGIKTELQKWISAGKGAVTNMLGN